MKTQTFGRSRRVWVGEQLLFVETASQPTFKRIRKIYPVPHLNFHNYLRENLHFYLFLPLIFTFGTMYIRPSIGPMFPFQQAEGVYTFFIRYTFYSFLTALIASYRYLKTLQACRPDLCHEALVDYVKNRGNGLNPDSATLMDLPKDGRYLWEKDETGLGYYYVVYKEGYRDHAWMQNKDQEYQVKLTTRLPNLFRPKNENIAQPLQQFEDEIKAHKTLTIPFPKMNFRKLMEFLVGTGVLDYADSISVKTYISRCSIADAINGHGPFNRQQLPIFQATAGLPGNEVAETMAALLEKGVGYQGLICDLNNLELDVESIESMAVALQSGQCPQRLYVALRHNDIPSDGAGMIAAALRSRRCPEGVYIDLGDNNVRNEGAILIAQALLSDNCPPNLHIDLSGNNIGIKGIDAIAVALESQRCPGGLHVGLGNNNLGDKGVIRIARAFSSGNCPPNLHIDLGDNNIGINGRDVIAEALESRRCSDGLHVGLGNNNLGYGGVIRIARALSRGNCPPDLHIDLSGNNIGINGIDAIAVALESRRCPEGLHIGLGNNNLGDGGAIRIAQALSSSDCPANLYIDLSDNNIGINGINAIAKALEGGRCPIGLHIGLGNNNLGDEGVTRMVQALSRGNCPSNLHIGLERNNIGINGARAIAGMLKSEAMSCPRRLNINLSQNNVADEGALEIAIALQSEFCPRWLSINLSYNHLGNDGAKAIVSALGNCQRELQIVQYEEDADVKQLLEFDKALRILYNPESIKKEAALTFALGIDSRVGHDSPVQGLPKELAKKICKLGIFGVPREQEPRGLLGRAKDAFVSHLPSSAF